MRLRRLAGWLACGCLLFARLALAADLGGTYHSEQLTLQLAVRDGAYTGTLTIKGKVYPVTAKENAGKLEGTFTSDGTPFPFTATLNGDTLTLVSGNASYALKHAAANPLENIGQPNPPQPQPQPQSQPQPQPHPQPQPIPAQSADVLDALRNLGPVQTDANRDWLMIVYMDGDNSLEVDCVPNIKQMEAGLSSGVDVIVLFDRPIRQDASGYLTRPRLYHVRKSEHGDRLDSEMIKEFSTPINMADPLVLSAIIEGATKAYPAREHMLVMWDHGGGWASMANDDHPAANTVEHDAMTLPRLRKGMADGMAAAGMKKWDIVAFDMCLMSQLEVAAQIHDLADVMVASEELVPGRGMPYTAVLEALGKKTLGGRKIGATIVTEFDKFHKADNQHDTTLAALDLGEFDNVNRSLNAVCDKLLPAMTSGWHPLVRSFFYAEQYNLTRDDFRNGPGALQSMDLMDALKKCRAATRNFPAEAEYQALVQAMDRFVIVNANSQHRQMSNGVSIYGPVIQSAYNPEYDSLLFAKESHWPQLLKAIYPEQARNATKPRFTRIELVDASGIPTPAVLPLAGMSTAIEIDGKDLIWIHDNVGVRNPGVDGVRILGSSYVIDPDFLKKIAEGKHLGADVDLIMPQFADGVSKLRQPQMGMQFLMNNGEKSIQAMFDSSNLSKSMTFTIPVEIQDPTRGPEKMQGILVGDTVTLGVARVRVFSSTSDGHVQYQELKLSENAVITPKFIVLKDDGTMSMVTRDSLAWKGGIHFTLDLLPPGDCEEVLTAETMTGASTTARFKFKSAADDKWARAKQSWANVPSEAMVGTWEWVIPGNPNRPTGYTLELKPTRFPFAYNMTLTAPGADGVPKSSGGLLFINQENTPFYHMITDAEAGQSGMMLGTAIWSPTATENRLITHDIALNMDLAWIKKGGGEPVVVLKHQPPPGWVTFTDAQKTFSIDMPPTFGDFKPAIQAGKTVFKGYQYCGADFQQGIVFEVIKFDGVKDPDTALQHFKLGAAQLGVNIGVGVPMAGTIAHTNSLTYAGAAGSAAGVNACIVNLIPTPHGYLAVNVFISALNLQAAEPTIRGIVESTQLLDAK